MKPLKRLERYLSAIFTLGRIKGLAKDAHRGVAQIHPRIAHLEDSAKDLTANTGHLSERADQFARDLTAMQASLDARAAHLQDADGRMNRISETIRRHETLAEDLVADYRREAAVLKRTGQSDSALLARMFTDLSRRLDGVPKGQGAPKSAAPKTTLPSTEGFDLFKDSFYHRLENQFRGAPEEIARRLRVYLPDVEAAWLRSGKLPAMDIGCGRGEWLGLLKTHGIAGFGIDTNAAQIEEAKEAGLDVRLGDALQALADQEDNSLSVITAHHLIEHLPFDAVAWITREAGRVLAPGGLLLFETPNTRNVLVGATTFHTDPTHLKPMPEQVMGVLFETAGFDPVDIRGLNPHARFNEFLGKPDFNDELAFLMFGPQDLAILGTKPKDA
ncbi:class I SAM-dependent methyltransferase [Sulfitobacter sp. KE42]|uniref:class I SAM-dependent methyltransferase n=1 Tax=Sulfitobacter sp. KE42 TaxID=2731155 RepID=UPI0023E0D9E4|nr:class I SAM-dependent methyltransferase [Sulfitobacter sp. KE42]